MSRIDFNSENYGHRLLLAQAMRDYARSPGRTLAGTKNGGEPSLLDALADAGIAMSKSNLDRIAAAGHPDDRDRPYGNNARRVAQFLEEKGYFPPGQKPDDALKLLPLFFGGYSESGASLLRELEGNYRSYQYNEDAPDLATCGAIVIGPITPLNYAPFQEVIGSHHGYRHSMICEGIVFTDDQKNIFMIGREHNRQLPRFYMFEGVDRVDGKSIALVYGTVLAGGMRSRRHLSPIALCRTDADERFEATSSSYLSELPEYVGHYLSMLLAPGPKNLSPGLTLAEIDERTREKRKHT